MGGFVIVGGKAEKVTGFWFCGFSIQLKAPKPTATIFFGFTMLVI